MDYCRKYRREDVARILRESEGRPRPYQGRSGHRLVGHAIGKHAIAPESVPGKIRSAQGGGRGRKSNLKDLTSFQSVEFLTSAVTEALNSVPGQRELRKLNEPTRFGVTIRSIIIREARSIDLFYVVYDPDYPDHPGEYESLAQEDRAGKSCLVEVFVSVWKLEPPGSRGEIHIQTAFPQEWEVVAP